MCLRRQLASDRPRTFRIFRKHHPHYSHSYGVQMNYGLFFTHDGKAIHQYHGIAPLAFVRAMKTNVTDFMGSHGCVRLKEEDARELYRWASVGTFVHVR
jgi:lipoprotein-anchoring transpeptidase ErfK/SrfK